VKHWFTKEKPVLNEPVQAEADPREIIIVEDDPLLRNLVVEIMADVGAQSQ